jgi:hypothetical protein
MTSLIESRRPSAVLSRNAARTLAVVKQGLAERPPVADKQTLLDIIRRIGLLQLDAINVVDRSHYLVMLSRVGQYDRASLDALLHPDRQLFEQWAHAACLIPAEDYHHFAPIIHARRHEPLSARKMQALGENPSATFESVLKAVTARGPLMSRDFADPRGKAGAWWNHKPAKVALDYLCYTGHIMIENRINFQCCYNLAERVLPQSTLPLRFDVGDWQRWATLRSVGCLGVGTARHIADYYRQTVPATRAALRALEDTGAVLRVHVEGWDEPGYMLAEDMPLVVEIEHGRRRSAITVLLSPFDNLLWYRPRVKELFDFEYRSEMYTPLAKRERVYGYYVMPILHHGNLIGRLDPKTDRRTSTLIIRSVYLEQRVRLTDELLRDLTGMLKEFMDFHACQSIRIEHAGPDNLGKAMMSAMERAQVAR